MNTLWECHPEAEQLIQRLLQEIILANEAVATLQKELKLKTSTRLMDWVDHIHIGTDPSLQYKLKEIGFEVELVAPTFDVWYHPGAQFPRILIQRESPKRVMGVSIIVESISDFLGIRGIHRAIEGAPFSPFRRSLISLENEISFWIVERRGTRVLEPTSPLKDNQIKYLDCLEKWKTRSRDVETLDNAFLLVKEFVAIFGTDFAASIIMEGERFYWQNRNFAAGIQKIRQDQMGMGWANHDHHTFRSSRENFEKLVQLFKLLGFHCRERFYAGKEAGWGAQVMENPRAGFVLFLDVDLTEEEINVDFAHQELKPLPKLGTVGLWCALHGDSILKGGMHHLEAQFSFDDLKEDLGKKGIELMKPFSNFAYLRQAFTKAELWPVEEKRLQSLVQNNQITLEQAEQFRTQGAIGSHLENLERKEGYKGFNQHNVSIIIKQTDPRTQ